MFLQGAQMVRQSVITGKSDIRQFDTYYNNLAAQYVVFSAGWDVSMYVLVLDISRSISRHQTSNIKHPVKASIIVELLHKRKLPYVVHTLVKALNLHLDGGKPD